MKYLHFTRAENTIPLRLNSIPAWFWAGAFVVLAIWFGTLDARHLLATDEGRYAEMAREMWASGDWVTTRYNDLKYFEKPPFHLWMTALAYQFFGVGEWQARLWVALSGMIGLLMTMLAAWRWWGLRAAGLAGLVLLASPNWNAVSHFNALDTSVSGALAVVLAATLIALHPAATRGQRRGWMLLAWAAMAVAVLTKGLIGIVLPGLVLVVYTLWARDWRIWARLHIVAGLALLLLICVPWFWLVAQRNPGFLQFFFIHEHFQRYTSEIHQRGEPVWYFLPQLAWGFLPWLGLLPGVVRQIKARDVDAQFQFRPNILLAAWAISIFVFFSASGSKLPGYILPVMPALALLAAGVLAQMPARVWRCQLRVALPLAALLVAGAVWFMLKPVHDDYGLVLHTYSFWLLAAVGLLFIGVVAAYRLQKQGLQDASVWSYGLAFFLATTIAMTGHETLGRGMSGINLVPAIRSVLKPDMPLYGVRKLDHTLPFYLTHPLVMVEDANELTFGVQQEPEKWLPTMDAFKQRWQSGPPALALMEPETYDELTAQGLPMFPVARDDRRVVVANFPHPVP